MDKRAGLSISPPLLQKPGVSPSRRLEGILGRDWRVALPFVLPIIVIVMGFIFWPFVNAILVSLTTRSLVTRVEQFVGLDNYARLLRDADFLSAVRNTIVFTVASVCIKFVAGMSIALILHQRLPFRSILSGIMLIPW